MAVYNVKIGCPQSFATSSYTASDPGRRVVKRVGSYTADFGEDVVLFARVVLADEFGGESSTEDLFCRTVIWRSIEGSDTVCESALYDLRRTESERIGIKLVIEGSSAEDKWWKVCGELGTWFDHGR